MNENKKFLITFNLLLLKSDFSNIKFNISLQISEKI